MNKSIKKIIQTILFIIVICSITKVQAKTEGFYYSSKFIEGTILTWETTKYGFDPEPFEDEPDLIEIIIIQDIPDSPIDFDNLHEYFNMTLNSVIVLAEFLGFAFARYLFANLYVSDNVSYSLFEYYSNLYDPLPPGLEIEQKRGNMIITTSSESHYKEIIVDEETGIVREKIDQFQGDDYELNEKTKYTGGISLVENEFSNVMIIIIGIASLQHIGRRKKRTIISRRIDIS